MAYGWNNARLEAAARVMTARLEAAEAISTDDLCYPDSTGQMAKVDADADTTCNTMLAIAMEPMVADYMGNFTLLGMHYTTGLTPGDILYASTTAGGWSNSTPTGTGDIVRVIGYSVTTTKMYFNPDRTWIELA